MPYFAEPCRTAPGLVAADSTCACVASRLATNPGTACTDTEGPGASGSSAACQNGCVSGTASARNALNAQYGDALDV